MRLDEVIILPLQKGNESQNLNGIKMTRAPRNETMMKHFNLTEQPLVC